MTHVRFSILQVAQAHEEGATSVTLENTLGPILAFVIIILAVVVAKRIKKIKPALPAGRKENHYEQRN